MNILFAVIRAGGGHIATARAMSEAVQREDPSVNVRISDYMHELGLHKQDARHKELWKWLLARPRVTMAGQRLLDASPGLSRRYHELTLDRFARLAAEDLNRTMPDLVVANHGWLAVGLTRARLRYGLRARVLVYANEPLDANALWAEPRAGLVLAPSAGAAASLLRLGMPQDRVRVSSYAVAQAFLRTAPPRDDAARPLRVLLSLGGEGVSANVGQLVRAVASAGHSLTVLAGRNERLRQELLSGAPDEVEVLGFSDRVAELIASHDVVAGKAGPASVMEALAVGRPFLATGYATLNERTVVRFLDANGLGGLVRTPEELVAALDRYDAQALGHVYTQTRKLDFPGMTNRLARALIAYARDGAIPEELLDRGLDASLAGYTS